QRPRARGGARRHGRGRRGPVGGGHHGQRGAGGGDAADAGGHRLMGGRRRRKGAGPPLPVLRRPGGGEVAVGANGIGYAPQAARRSMTMNRMPSATLGLAALGVLLVGCSTSMDLGSAYYRKGEYVAAAAAVNEGVAQNPRSAAAWNNRAATRLRLGDVNGAIA